MSALSEALFRTAELGASTLALERPPPYRGPATEDGMRAWAEGPLAAWRDRQLSLFEPITAAYERVAEHEIPEWLIAAAERIAELHARVLDAAESIPAPPATQRDDALASAFDRLRADALAPVRAVAVARYEYAATMARSTRWFSEVSVRAEDALALLAPSRCSAPRELHGEPSWTDRAGVEPPPLRVEAQRD